MSEDMSNLMSQINQMIENNQIPENIKNMIDGLKQNTNTKSENIAEPLKHSTDNEDTINTDDKTSSNSSQTSYQEFDIGTMMKMKKIVDSINTNKNDPRANLLLSLKPYLKDSRKDKVDQYIQIFKMGKVFEILNPLGGESKK